MRKSEIERLKEIHRKAGYGFEFPDVQHFEVGTLIKDDSGYIVGWVGAELEAQIIGMFDPEWGSPHERVRKFASLHLPIAEQLKKRGVKNAYVFLDPQFRNFGKRLSRLGWHRARWETFFMKVTDCIKALKR